MAPILYSLLAVGSLLSLAYSAPAPSGSPKKLCRSSGGGGGNGKVLTTEELQAKQPTLDGLASNTNVTLVYSVLGIGTQNYTCNGTAYVQTIPTSGAEALLYDTTEYLKTHPGKIDDLSQKCNYEGCKIPAIKHHLLGNHYFDASDRPTFNLSHAHPPLVLSAKKLDDVKASTSTDIDWLLLVDADDGISKGLSEVYRIDTFGGVLSDTSCSTAGTTVTEPYTAQYWFYD